MTPDSNPLGKYGSRPFLIERICCIVISLFAVIPWSWIVFQFPDFRGFLRLFICGLPLIFAFTPRRIFEIFWKEATRRGWSSRGGYH